ncbi:unnamed protein product [Pleuronectes platessa]|uniref:Uncharacterized protein n=1 Tax=Pleuronectes platessa TaxID=8262 RepID=A0A9N7VE15_PLEPL|nr:unnamed protein product [Pleuronectes platessa]
MQANSDPHKLMDVFKSPSQELKRFEVHLSAPISHTPLSIWSKWAGAGGPGGRPASGGPRERSWRSDAHCFIGILSGSNHTVKLGLEACLLALSTAEQQSSSVCVRLSLIRTNKPAFLSLKTDHHRLHSRFACVRGGYSISPGSLQRERQVVYRRHNTLQLHTVVHSILHEETAEKPQ